MFKWGHVSRACLVAHRTCISHIFQQIQYPNLTLRPCCAVPCCAVSVWDALVSSPTTSDARVALLGASQALFEASMYTFVFLWTPALSPAGEKLPHGFIFAIFMTASMVGTALAGRLLHSVPLESLMQVCEVG